MIVGVPDFQELHDTAIGWLNLAWQITITEVIGFQDTIELLEDISKEDASTRVEEEAAKYWHSARYKLNNAISLLQQALEIELKSRIAKDRLCTSVRSI